MSLTTSNIGASLYATSNGPIKRISEKELESPNSVFDLIIIGGGINGCSIAREASSRGLKVLLVEKNDYGSGCSSGSTRLIHGGLRYLEHLEILLVRESLRERERLLKNANHLVKPIEMAIPIYQGDKRGYGKIKLGMLGYDLLSLDKSLPWHKMMREKDFLNYEPSVSSDGLVGGAVYYDAQVELAERLCLENILMAAENGATILNHAEVVEIEQSKNKIQSVEIYDGLTGETFKAKGSLIVNVAGPWVDEICGIADAGIDRQMGGTKGSHFVVKGIEGGPKRAIYSAASDGRPFFIIPWRGNYLIGTTDKEFEGSLDSVKPDTSEIDYLISESNRVIGDGKIKKENIIFSYSHVRPLPYQPGVPPNKKTRSHIIKSHPELENFESIIGGKLTTARGLSEDYVSHAVKLLGKGDKKSPTRKAFYPGATPFNIEEFRRDHIGPSSERYKLPPEVIGNLIDVYGSRYDLPLKASGQNEPDKGFLTSGELDIRAQVTHAILNEGAYSIRGVFGRLPIGLSEHLDSAPAIDYVAASLRNHLGYTKKATDGQIKDYLDNIVSRRKVS